MAATLAAAENIRDRLAAGGVRAVLDVREVLGSTPCVLIPPPAWDDWAGDGSPLFTWRLIALSGQGLGNLDAWRELDDLVEAVDAVLPLGRAEPVSYELPTGGTRLPAYAITYTGS